MGFFSSRKTLAEDGYLTDGAVDSEKSTVVKVIRSRFYGKHTKDKEKERERDGSDPHPIATTFFSQDATTAQTLSIPIPNTSKSNIRKARSTNNILRSPSLSTHSPLAGADTSTGTLSRGLSISDRLRPTRVKPTSISRHTHTHASPTDATGTLFPSASASTSKSLLSPTEPSSPKPKSIRSIAMSATDPKPNPNSHTPKRPTNTDSATMSLAQRLNKLAVANSEGLLDDDEYRLLRQNLFERFASNAAVPTETPVVPAHSSPTPRSKNHLRGLSTTSTDRRSSISRPPSQFIVDANVASRSPSIRSTSKGSLRSGVSGLFQRVTSHGHHKQASSSRGYHYGNSTDLDASSVYSRETSTGGGGGSGSIFRSPLKKKSSNASVGSQQTDAISVSSKKTGDHHSVYSYSYPQTPRSTAGNSFRHLASPPSSFYGHGSRSIHSVTESKYAGEAHTLYDDDETLKSSKDIKNEIAAVEAEAKSLMDAFNGLEVTILAKRQRGPDAKAVRLVELSSDEGGGGGGDRGTGGRSQGQGQGQGQQGSTWTLVPDQKLALKIDSDGASVLSGISIGTSPSMSVNRSLFLRTVPSKGSSSMMSSLANSAASSSRPGSLHRKNSSSSMASSRLGSSAGGGGGGTAAGQHKSKIPPVPALPPNMGQYLSGHASNSSLNLTRSTGHLPMRSVPEDEVKSVSSVHEAEEDVFGGGELDAEMEEIRRRREAVSRRYAARVEYLRARLKGAQLHEKLMRK